MAGYDILLIDINSIGYSAMYQPNLAKLSFNGQSTSALHGALLSVFALVNAHPGAIPVLLWDGTAQWRKDLYPDYKGDRGSTPEKLAIRADYRRQAAILRKLFWGAGVPMVRSSSAEADDLAGQITREIHDYYPGARILMTTKDTDWWQALGENVHWYSSLTKQLVTLDVFATAEVKDGPFDSSAQYIEAKAMAGDTSDCIEGISRVGITTALKAIRKYGSFKQICEAVDAGLAAKDNLAIKIGENRGMVERNIKLMDWSVGPRISGDVSIVSTAKDIRIVEEVAADHGLKKAQSQVESFSMDESRRRQVISAIEMCFS